MIESKGYAAQAAGEPLAPWTFERRDLGPADVQIEIDYCGVCHSDLHQARNEWGFATFPLVPGHEIVGRVTKVGAEVTRFKEGDLAGVGCLVDSCRTCHSCKEGLEQYCENGNVSTYSATGKDGLTTYGGYSNNIIVDQDFVLTIPKNLDLSRVAPLLCAGITTYSPLKHWGITKGHKVAVLGLGGLGHMAVKIAASMGAEVTVLSTSASKEQDARDLGAHKFVLTKDEAQVQQVQSYFDFIINTVSAVIDYNMYLNMLHRDGTMICLGAPPEAPQVHPFSLIFKRRRIAGSLIGGLPETQEMLDYCAEHNIMSDVEVIPMSEINTAYERMLKGDVKYRFVIDMKTLDA